jgi:hypothetical protein
LFVLGSIFVSGTFLAVTQTEALAYGDVTTVARDTHFDGCHHTIGLGIDARD